MTKEELRTGDIIVNRGGYLGVVLRDEKYILYQEIGSDDLIDFNEDLTFDDDEYRDGDIMQVYRGNTFIDLEENWPYWERDEQWSRPTVEERKERELKLEQERQKKIEELCKVEVATSDDNIFIISQCFYGNRTGTKIKRERIDHFLCGCIDDHDILDEVKDVDRKIVHLPNSENVVIIYDQTQEDRYVNILFPEYYANYGAEYKEHTGNEMTMQVTCEIPEIDFKIHTRCFACRMDQNNVFQSLEGEDMDMFIHYFPER